MATGAAGRAGAGRAGPGAGRAAGLPPPAAGGPGEAAGCRAAARHGTMVHHSGSIQSFRQQKGKVSGGGAGDGCGGTALRAPTGGIGAAGTPPGRPWGPLGWQDTGCAGRQALG